MSFYAVHVTDSKWIPKIKQQGLHSGTAPDLWLGKGVYFSFLHSQKNFQECYDYGVKFVKEKEEFSGEVGIVLAKLELDGSIYLQEKILNERLTEFKTIFVNKAADAGYKLELNDDSKGSRPESYARREVCKYLMERLGEEQTVINASLCRFPLEPSEDIPRQPPIEICVHNESTINILEAGTYHDVHHELIEKKYKTDPQLYDKLKSRNHNAKATAAVLEASSYLKNIDAKDFHKLMDRAVPTLADQRVFANDNIIFKNLRAALKARNLNIDVVDSDLKIVYEDYKRRNQFRRIEESHQKKPPEASFLRGILDEPSLAAKAIYMRHPIEREDNFISQVLENLGLSIRRLPIAGTAYFFPRNCLTKEAVLIIRESRGQTIKSDLFHELAHVIYNDYSMNTSNEEEWCDMFADELSKLRKK